MAGVLLYPTSRTNQSSVQPLTWKPLLLGGKASRPASFALTATLAALCVLGGLACLVERATAGARQSHQRIQRHPCKSMTCRDAAECCGAAAAAAVAVVCWLKTSETSAPPRCSAMSKARLVSPPSSSSTRPRPRSPPATASTAPGSTRSKPATRPRARPPSSHARGVPGPHPARHRPRRSSWSCGCARTPRGRP